MSTTILTDTAKEAVDDAIATALGDVYDCNRVWDAWSYGTMGPDDFSLVAEDSDRLREITDAAIQAILQSPEVQAWKRDAERLDWLADPNNSIGNVQLPTECVTENLHSLRAAIDAAMEKQP